MQENISINIQKVKIAVTVPRNSTQKLRDAICNAGAGIIGTCHIQSKPPIQWFAPSYSAGGKSVRDFLPGKIKAQGIATGGPGRTVPQRDPKGFV